jgi:hypothetical protein
MDYKLKIIYENLYKEEDDFKLNIADTGFNDDAVPVYNMDMHNVNAEALLKYALWDYTRITGLETIPCTFRDRHASERYKVSKSEAKIINAMHRAFLEYNYKMSKDTSYYGTIYAEWEIPFANKKNEFVASKSEIKYNVKFIEEIDRVEPELATKLMENGFDDPMPQTKESLDILSNDENYLNGELEGKIKVSTHNDMIDGD